MSAKVLKIAAVGRYEFCDVETDEDGNIDLTVLQNAVCGWVEHVGIPKPGCERLDMWLNEEGKLNGLPINQIATNLSELWKHGDFIVGDVVVCAHTPEGDSVGLSAEEESTLRELLRRC